MYEFSLWGRDFTSVVRITEGPYYRDYFYKECMGIFPGPSELSIREVPVRRGSTVVINSNTGDEAPSKKKKKKLKTEVSL